jgi:pimeloyl-ACP methyl ester carboxylesterase
MNSKQTPEPQAESLSEMFGICGQTMEYAIDAAQRTVLFWDVMRQRGNQFREHMAETVPHVLHYEVEPIIDGRTLNRPVNYGLVRIVPPKGTVIDPSRRPFVIVDPRAGHGPGIGGFKADSEIGVAFKAGHPCYFVGFLPDPMPGQTIEDIARAEAVFLEKVIALHPDADGKPCVVGNCQAGWAVMMLAALRPELFGPIIIAGSPLSYWAGVHGKNPMRYSGGLLGGSWLPALTSDLGAGKFDGAWLVHNFENQNRANTLWTKQYNVYSKVDTEAPRYLDFERYWGGYVHLNAEEIQFIVDQLFIGNNLAAGKIKTSDGVAVDLRNIRSPIVVFCSKGDNITPPQQALGWILDLYDDVDDIRRYGQTIVYTIHDKIGHLGIFVAGAVAKKEHSEFANNIDLIDTLPPGLYEAVFEPKTDSTRGADLVTGDWVMRCELRTLDDIRGLGGNDAADERRFATAAHVYRTFAQPLVRSLASAPVAQSMQKLHPLRVQYEIFSDANPIMAPLATMAEQVRRNRRPAAPDNPFIAMQENASKQIVAALDGWRGFIETIAERTFLTVYGSPALQAAAGIDPADTQPLRKPAKNRLYQELLQNRIAELKSRIGAGGLREAVVCALLYLGLGAAPSTNGDSSLCVVSVAVMGICGYRNSRRSCAISSQSSSSIGRRRSPPFPRCFRPMPKRGAKPSIWCGKSWRLAGRYRRRTRSGWARLVGCLGSRRKAALFRFRKTGSSFQRKRLRKRRPQENQYQRRNDHTPGRRNRCYYDTRPVSLSPRPMRPASYLARGCPSFSLRVQIPCARAWLPVRSPTPVARLHHCRPSDELTS